MVGHLICWVSDFNCKLRVDRLHRTHKSTKPKQSAKDYSLGGEGGRVDGRMDEWVDERVDGRVDEGMDE